MTQTDLTMDLTQAEARLPRWMLALAGAGTMGILLSTHVRFGAGFAVGAGLGILNYLWLHQAVDVMMSGGRARPSATVLAKMLVRYPLAFGVVYLFYKTGWLPFQAILAGLFVPLGGVLIESIALIHGALKGQA